MDGNRARFGFETLPDPKSTSEATKHLNGSMMPARMTIRHKTRTRNFPEPKSAIARVQTHRTPKKKPGQKSHRMRNLLLFHVLMYNFFSSCRREPMLYLPLSPIIIIIVSKITLPPQNPPRKQATRKASERSVKDPYLKMLCNDP